MEGQKSGTTAQRLKTIMDSRRLRQVDIIERAKPICQQYNVRLNKNDLSQYCSGKVEPGQEKLTILSLVLDVSEAWLMGYDVPMERQKQPAAHNGLVDEFKMLFGQLSPEKQRVVLVVIKALLEDQAKSSDFQA